MSSSVPGPEIKSEQAASNGVSHPAADGTPQHGQRGITQPRLGPRPVRQFFNGRRCCPSPRRGRGQVERWRIDGVVAPSRQCRGCIQCQRERRVQLGRPFTLRQVARSLGPLGRLASPHRSAAPGSRRATFEIARLNSEPELASVGTAEVGLRLRQGSIQFRGSAFGSIGIPPPPIAER
jgi:hypothetical protein